MSRPKGSKNKTTLMKEQGNVKTPVKKVVKNNSTKEHIKALNTKKGKTTMPKHVLKLNDWLYITCDSHCWKIVEVNNKKNPTTGEKYPDKSLLYATNLQDILKVAVSYMIRVPDEYQNIIKRINDCYDLIDARVPVNTKPKDLFEEYQCEEEEGLE